MLAEVSQLRLVLDSLPVFVFVKDDRNTILELNQVAADSMGQPQEAIRGRPADAFFSKNDAEAYLRDDLEVLASGEPKLGYVESYETAGRRRHVRTYKVPLPPAPGGGQRIVAVAFDVTEEIGIARQLEASLARARLISRAAVVSSEAESPEEGLREVLQLLCETFALAAGVVLVQNPDAELIPLAQWGAWEDGKLTWGAAPLHRHVAQTKRVCWTHGTMRCCMDCPASPMAP